MSMAEASLSEQAFFVLASLTGGPLHGYAMISEVAEMSDGRIRMPVGTLYGVLDRLAVAGRIEVDREEIVDSRLRRYYRLTPGGRGLLESEVARQAANVREISRRLGQAGRPAAAIS